MEVGPKRLSLSWRYLAARQTMIFINEKVAHRRWHPFANDYARHGSPKCSDQEWTTGLVWVLVQSRPIAPPHNQGRFAPEYVIQSWARFTLKGSFPT